MLLLRLTLAFLIERGKTFGCAGIVIGVRPYPSYIATVAIRFRLGHLAVDRRVFGGTGGWAEARPENE